MTLDQIEELYEAHDELLENPLRAGDRNLASDNSFRLLFMWQFTEYNRLLGRCMRVACSDEPEFKQARHYLRNAEGLARGSVNLREATATAEVALQYIHKWLQRARAELRAAHLPVYQPCPKCGREMFGLSQFKIDKHIKKCEVTKEE